MYQHTVIKVRKDVLGERSVYQHTVINLERMLCEGLCIMCEFRAQVFTRFEEGNRKGVFR